MGPKRTLEKEANAMPPELPRLDRRTPGRASRRILRVDDNADMAEGRAGLLEHSGHEVWTERDGSSAIGSARAHGPDSVLLDIDPPGRDGYEVAAQLRQQQELANTVIVAISAYVRGIDRSPSEPANFDHDLVKPVNDNEPLTLLGRES
jgi:two-component system OmpR family response regulator